MAVDLDHPSASHVSSLAVLTRRIVKSPRSFLFFATIATLFVAFYAVANLKINSSRSDLIDSEAPFRQTYDAFQEAFPSFRNTILVAVKGESGLAASEATRLLYDQLSPRTDIFSSVFSPSADPFFRDHALLYLDTDQLEEVSAQLARAQPALTALAQDPTLRGLFDLLGAGLEAYGRGESLPPYFVEMMDRISDTAEAELAGQAEDLPWNDVFVGHDFGTHLQIIVIQAREDFTQLVSGRRAIEVIRQSVEDLGLTSEQGISVRLTGAVPLAYEEMRAVGQSVGLAGFLSTLFLTVILAFGIRSLRIIIAVLITVSAGLVWTMAWAMWSVGELNMVSATFAVLFIGLGVDFAIHLALRYQEAIEHGAENDKALIVAAASTGGAVSLCALTSAIGFLSFIPTRYRGVADLGIIAGGGMVFALLSALLILAAFLAVFGPPTGRAAGAAFVAATGRLFHAIERHARQVAVISLVVLLGAAFVSTKIGFDFSTLTLKNQDSESITTLQELQENGIVTDYAISVLAKNRQAVPEVAQQLAQLSTVREVLTPESYVPRDQDYKLELLQEAAFLLWPALTAPEQSPELTAGERRKAVSDLVAVLESFSPRPDDAAVATAVRRLAFLLKALESDPEAAVLLANLDRHLTANVHQPIEFLRTALQVDAVTFDDLPEDVRARVVAADGRVRVVALPKEDMTSFEAMKRFVKDVTMVFPDATGRPVLEAGVGEVVVTAFKTALIVALIAIVFVLLLAVRSVVDTLIILVPLIMASCLTLATAVVVGIPLNQANIIVLPLIMGLGVDNGIHMVLRFREDGSMENLLTSSTPRAIILSTLTTVAAFGALSLSLHQGIRSMGLLLTMSMGYLLVCTIIVLPALLYWHALALSQGRSTVSVKP